MATPSNLGKIKETCNLILVCFYGIMLKGNDRRGFLSVNFISLLELAFV